MRRIVKWVLVSGGGGLVVTAGLLFFGVLLDPPEPYARFVFWPVTLLVAAAGSGLPLGSHNPPRYEWTPVHELAVALGFGLSWVFYSSLVAVLVLLVRRRPSQ